MQPPTLNSSTNNVLKKWENIIIYHIIVTPLLCDQPHEEAAIHDNCVVLGSQTATLIIGDFLFSKVKG